MPEENRKTKKLKLEDYPEILVGKELAEFLRISERTLYNRRSTGYNLPPSLKFGSKIVYARSDVRAWLDGMTHSGNRNV